MFTVRRQLTSQQFFSYVYAFEKSKVLHQIFCIFKFHGAFTKPVFISHAQIGFVIGITTQRTSEIMKIGIIILISQKPQSGLSNFKIITWVHCSSFSLSTSKGKEKKAMKRKGAQVRAGGRCTFRQGRTLELLLAVSGREGSAERPQVPTLHLVHEVEELPEHLHRQRPEGHFRHKQPNAESAC